MRTKLLAVMALLWALGTAPVLRADDQDMSKSVVKIYTVTNDPNYYQPWVLGYQYNASGSGCILPGHRILTNAHVVSNQVFIQVMKAGDTDKYTAHVEYVDHDREVAILKVQDDSFFDGTTPVVFGDLPQQRDKVVVYGFPEGGEELATTEGVVSRIEVETYVHSQKDFLAIQTDAAINPGNSGGPAFKDGKMIGIAFQAVSSDQAQNIGYIVPMSIVEESLKDMRTGIKGGAPDLGIAWQKMESSSLRKFFKMPGKQEGVLVTKVVYNSPAWGQVQEKDVLTSVGGVPIANDGTIPFRKGDRLDFSYVVTQYQMGQTISLGIIRDGKPMSLELPLQPYDGLVPGPRYDIRPSYYIYAGLVFMPLTADFLDLYKNGGMPAQLADYYANGLPSADRKQVIFINEVLPHDVNVGYHSLKQAVVVEVNGRPISELKDVVEALKHPEGNYDLIELDHAFGDGDNFGNWVVLDAAQADEATQEILKNFDIPKDRSDDLDDASPSNGPAGDAAPAASTP